MSAVDLPPHNLARRWSIELRVMADTLPQIAAELRRIAKVAEAGDIGARADSGASVSAAWHLVERPDVRPGEYLAALDAAYERLAQ